MIEKGSFRWDAKKDQAALLIARGELTNEEIADEIDIGVATLFRWKNYQEFQERVAENVALYRESVLTQEIGDIVNRIRRYNKRWQEIDRLIAERASDAKMVGVAGGTTGLLVHDVKSVGSGEHAYTVDVYKFDAALVREERELAKQAAQECGQWRDEVRTELVGKDGGAVQVEMKADLTGLTREEKETLLAMLEKAEAAKA